MSEPSVELEPGPDPIVTYLGWLAEAGQTEPNDPEAANLATVTAEGRPRSRMVLLRGADSQGFRFFTNRQSDKGRELWAAAWAALCIHWKSLGRQVRVEGAVHLLDDAESDAYWATRPRESQLGGWASDQSQPIGSRQELADKLAKIESHFEGLDVPRPPHWGGYLLAPQRIELWQGRAGRLHDRWCFERSHDAEVWRMTLLQP